MTALAFTQTRPMENPHDMAQKAESLLKVLVSKDVNDRDVTDILSKSVACGPLLWELLAKEGKIPTGSNPVNLIIDERIALKGKERSNPMHVGFYSGTAEVLDFNKKFIRTEIAGKQTRIRRADAKEESYFRAIVFSPQMVGTLMTVEVGVDKYVFNFQEEGGGFHITWVEIIGEVIK